MSDPFGNPEGQFHRDAAHFFLLCFPVYFSVAESPKKVYGGPQHCEYCGTLCQSRSGRIAHERIHTGERPYSCVTCGKSFQLKHHLTRHNTRGVCKI